MGQRSGSVVSPSRPAPDASPRSDASLSGADRDACTPSRGTGLSHWTVPHSSVGPMTRLGRAHCSGGGGLAYSLPADTYRYGSNTARRTPKRHRIADIHYGRRVPGVAGYDGPSSLDCGCGTGLSAPTPEALADLWRAHGGSVK